ncbi:hypothetical protein LCGC14_2374020 [marine sediment metagenome]|uniref:Uncharacterized protein n=1 Tax=marine sediment metagenome TaxID=412755 RepID=A0A0F9C2X3_9ZZZZ
MRAGAIILLALCVCAVPAAVLADDYTAAVGGNWDVSTNWDPSTGFPGSGDTALIDAARMLANIDIDTGITLITVDPGGNLGVADTALDQLGLSVTLAGGMFGPSTSADRNYHGSLVLTAATTSTIYTGSSGEADFYVFGTGKGVLLSLVKLACRSISRRAER